QQQGIAVVSVPHFLQTASDNATPLDRLTFGIRKAGTGTGFPLNGLGGARTHEMFRCDELGTHTIELWVKDLAGNTSFCEATVTVQDLMSLCPPESAGAFVEVCMNTQANDGVEEGHFEVSGNNPNGSFEITDWTLGGGCGLFEVPLGSDVTIAPNKNDNPLNGVTVYDLVLISKHILGIELLDSPYKMIAADTDRNGLIDSTDIVELRKLIMGTYTELPNNTSWRFVPKDYQFADPSNPFSEAFPESASFNNLQGYERAQFVGIKVGDVNNTSVVNFKGIGSEERGGIKVGDVNNTAVANFTGIGSEERGGIREHHEVTVGQPRPNPTLDAAALPIYLPTAENLRLEISDLTGRIIWANDLQLEMGSHALEIPASTLPSAGVYVWRVRTGEISKAGKLLRH
ncbi:MAG: T9SS type A sorting domain-containing protein, partial [Saprospiraceae bacterium]